MSSDHDHLVSAQDAPAEAEAFEDLALSDDYALNPQYSKMVMEAADRGDTARLRDLLAPLHPADVADLMGFLTAEYREEVIPSLPPEKLPEILSELEDNIRDEVLERLPPAVLAKALGELESDDATDLFEDLEKEKQDAVLAAMSDVERAAIESSLSYGEESAGRLMQREVLAAPQFWTVDQTIEHVRRTADELPELFFDVYVVDPAFRPIGAVAVSQLLKAPPDALLSTVMEPVTEISVDMDQEEVAYIFDKYHLVSAPVTDAGGRLVGQITVDDVVGVIQEESQEDILALAGVSDAGRDASVLGVVQSRLPWLVVNTITAAVAAAVIRGFQGEIEQLVTLAVLMPIVASLGGNAGTQTLTVAVRALAIKELNASNAMRTLGREMISAAMSGLALAALLGLASYALFKDALLSLTLGMALIINLVIGALGGLLVPLTLDRLGRDPAVSSPILVTFLTDAMGFFSFLGLAAVILL